MRWCPHREQRIEICSGCSCSIMSSSEPNEADGKTLHLDCSIGVFSGDQLGKQYRSLMPGVSGVVPVTELRLDCFRRRSPLTIIITNRQLTANAMLFSYSHHPS